MNENYLLTGIAAALGLVAAILFNAFCVMGFIAGVVMDANDCLFNREGLKK